MVEFWIVLAMFLVTCGAFAGSAWLHWKAGDWPFKGPH